MRAAETHQSECDRDELSNEDGKRLLRFYFERDEQGDAGLSASSFRVGAVHGSTSNDA